MGLSVVVLSMWSRAGARSSSGFMLHFACPSTAVAVPVHVLVGRLPTRVRVALDLHVATTCRLRPYRCLAYSCAAAVLESL